MIYELVPPDKPIRQGDIFRRPPRLDPSLDRLAVIEDDGLQETTWSDVLSDSDTTNEPAFLAAIKEVGSWTFGVKTVPLRLSTIWNSNIFQSVLAVFHPFRPMS